MTAPSRPIALSGPAAPHDPRRRRTLAWMGLAVLALHLLGWGGFLLAVAPHGYSTAAGSGFGAGLALTAYLLGVRHAFDADHIAAIDNTSRKLAAGGDPPVSTGFWFALGHSTVVLLAVGLLAAGVDAVAGQLTDDASVLRQFSGVWGPAVSGTFLLAIGAINLLALRGIVRAYRKLRDGRYNEVELERTLDQRGLVARMLAPVARRVDKAWKLYPLGFLFGLGLDTATTIGLFVVAGGAVVVLPWQAVMVLPLLFTAGMVLFDSLDGILMSRVYRWAFDSPKRKLFYNLVITAVSVLAAFGVGAWVLGGLFTETLALESGPVAWLGNLNLEYLGFSVVGLFVGVWGIAYAFWRVSGERLAAAEKG
ncbi:MULTISPECIES: HoxN/HupN/NixA family nickel/cobalt transporter [unclassified Arthrobacter]|uniref:HoxN/HupN/NixA family nickel/cobalt transporter n=1 Tax=unclassified Arthrobacter TaxID=235627 RepID=UPI00210601AF|nr:MULTISPECIES: HoxN/HupN/NixA family nickel/cobalt transporter [unclassified Arthrobacter]MCQ1947691.1 HoxN/HupN/NixA family nickel/cobalt transporter [Arthrobacter sp. zg-Y1116]MCQ1987634.1 HoxN/HupN/NixA family nickel/cobalt transporter [Arthrobacter sp. zg-Y844]